VSSQNSIFLSKGFIPHATAGVVDIGRLF